MRQSRPLRDGLSSSLGHVRSVLVAIAALAAVLNCTRASSNTAENRPPSSRKANENPDALPGYLIDRSYFGFQPADQLFSDIIIAPFSQVATDGSAVISLNTAPPSGEYAVAVYAPPLGKACSEFASEIESGSWAGEEKHIQARTFIMQSDTSLSPDGLSLTITFDAADARLPCTALVVAPALPLDAGYKAFAGTVAFLFTGDVLGGVYNGSESTRFITNAIGSSNLRGDWTSEVVEVGEAYSSTLVLRQLPRNDGSFIAGTGVVKISERQTDATWTQRGAYDTTWGYGQDNAIVDIQIWNDGANEITIALNGFTGYDEPDFEIQRRASASGNFSKFTLASRADDLHAGSLSQKRVLMGAISKHTPATVNLIDPSVGSASQVHAELYLEGEPCNQVLTSGATIVDDNDVVHFAIACHEDGQSNPDTSRLVYGRLIASETVSPDTISHFLITPPDAADFPTISRQSPPYMQLDASGTMHLIYRSRSSAHMWYATVTSAGAVDVEVVTMELAAEVSNFTYANLQAQRQVDGRIHIIFMAPYSVEQHRVVQYGIFTPGSGKIALKWIAGAGFDGKLSNLVLYDPPDPIL